MFSRGSVISGKYVVIGQRYSPGGMASLAYVKPVDAPNAPTLVLKYCKDEREVYRRRFRRETRLLECYAGNARVVQLVDYNLDHNPPYFIMDFYPGGDLTSIAGMRHNPALQERVFGEMIACLAELHVRNHLHRDIKPQNFLIDAQDRIVIADFGISTEFDSPTRFTTTSEFWGTPGYAPPEFRNGGFKDATRASDIFMLGKTLYVLATDEDPMYLNLSAMPEALGVVIQKCCEFAPERRYQSLKELSTALKLAFDAILHRLDQFGVAERLLNSIRARAESEHVYVPQEIIKFVETLFVLPASQQHRLLFELPTAFFFSLTQKPVAMAVDRFLGCYGDFASEAAYAWSYAETITNNMAVLFSGLDLSLSARAFALEIAITSALRMNRFAAMDRCIEMITTVRDDSLAIAVYDVLKRHSKFVESIEPSACQSSVMRRTLTDIRTSAGIGA